MIDYFDSWVSSKLPDFVLVSYILNNFIFSSKHLTWGIEIQRVVNIRQTYVLNIEIIYIFV